MRNILKIVDQARKDLLASIRPLIAFDLFFKALAAIALAPLAAFILTKLISTSGRLSIGNEEIAGFLLSPAGIFWLLIFGVSTAAILFAEHGGIMLIVRARNAGRRLTAASALVIMVRDLPRLAKLGAIQIGAHVLRLIVPLAVVGITYVKLLSPYDIYYLTTEQPPVWWIALGIAGLMALVVFFVNGKLYIKWILALPVVIQEDKQPREALAKSESLMRSIGFPTALLLLGSGIAVGLLPGLVTTSFDLLGKIVFHVLPEKTALLLPALVLFFALYFIASWAATFFAVALNALIGYGVHASVVPYEERQKGLEALPSTEARAAGAAVWTPLLVVLAIAVGIASYAISRVELEDDVTITAHRGSSVTAPENTMTAVAQSIEDGADFAEIDVQEMGDGTIIMIHDTDFLRIANLKTKVWETTYDEVKELDVGSWFDPKFHGERIAKLEDVIRLVRGRIKLNIELKFHGKELNFEQSIVDILREEDFLDECIVTSLSFEGLQRVRELEPRLRIGQIVAKSIGNLSNLDGEIISVATGTATPAFIATMHNSGKEVHVWTINDRKMMSTFIDLGVNSIITDLPADLAALLEERKALSTEERLLLKTRALLLN